MTRRPVDFHPDAVEEAREAREWYEERSPDASRAFLAETWPGHTHGTRRYVMRRFPFLVVYRVEDQIQIVAVAHGRRRPGYWRAH